MARVNRGTELDFLVGSGTGDGGSRLRVPARGVWLREPSRAHLLGVILGDLSYNPGINAALFGPDQGKGARA